MWKYPVIVAGCAIALSLVELAYTFKDQTVAALGRRNTWLLVSVNVIVAVIVYYAFGVASPKGVNPLYSAVVVGFTYPVVLRSRISHFKPVGSADGVSFSLEKYYTAFQGYIFSGLHQGEYY